MNHEHHRHQPLRIATCNVEPAAYRLVASWAKGRGHKVVLVITTPGPPPREYTGHREIVASAPPEHDILVTTRLKRAAPLIAATGPDVILSYTFPLRIPGQVIGIPRLGAVNLHPSPLPQYRGPNPARMVYDGAPTLGATLHRTTEGFDAGPILGRAEAPMPAPPTVERVLDVWHSLLTAALDVGMARLGTGDPGDMQDEKEASYAAAFTPEEHWLDWHWPAGVLQRRATALNLLFPAARARLHGEPIVVSEVTPVAYHGEHLPGDIIEEWEDHAVIAVADGAVSVSFSRGEPDAVLTSRGGEVVERDIAGA
ncbi:MAG TPA: formyltransferase family protein [Thermomicrobiales bacterium]|nr:formyltransferase family protein [Thermomicrobiales bacterium]